MSIGIGEWSRMLGRIGAEGFRRALGAAAIGTALDAESKAKERATGGNPLNVRTGRLRASIAGTVREESGHVDIVLSAGGRSGGEPVRYAGVHEYGATITPTRRQWLALPNKRNAHLLTAAGVARYASPRDVPDLYFRRTKRPDLALLVHRETQEVWFWLRKRVTIPPRPYLRPSLDEAAGELSNRLRAAVLREFEGAAP